MTPAGSKTLEFGQVLLSPGGPSLPELAVEKGWVKIRDGAGSNDNSEEANALLERLRSLEAKARAEGVGLWEPSPPVIETTYDVADAEAFFGQWKGEVLNGIEPLSCLSLNDFGHKWLNFLLLLLLFPRK